MNSNEQSSPIQDRNILSASLPIETNSQLQKKEGLTAKLRHKINTTGKHVQSSRDKKLSLPDLTTLTPQSQKLLFHAIDIMKNEDSKTIMTTLNESRDLLRSSFEEFTCEQNAYKKQLEEIIRTKELVRQRRKENVIPLSMFMRQKRDIQGLADLRPNSGMNPRYQAYFEALLTPDKKQQQHPSDKAAVIKYIRRRERRKRAEANRQNHELTDDVLKKQTEELIEEIDGMDVKIERERQRQNNLLHVKINEKKIKTKTMLEVNEIIGQANEANLIRQHVEQTQRDKIEARLSAARHHQNRTPTNMIYVQSDSNDQLNDEQKSITKNSIHLLNENDSYKPIRSTTPIYGDEDLNNKISNIHI